MEKKIAKTDAESACFGENQIYRRTIPEFNYHTFVGNPDAYFKNRTEIEVIPQ